MSQRKKGKSGESLGSSFKREINDIKLKAKKLEMVYKAKPRTKKEIDQHSRKRESPSPKYLQPQLHRDVKEDLKKTKQLYNYSQILGSGHDAHFKTVHLETPHKTVLSSSEVIQGARKGVKKSPVKNTEKFSRTG